MGLISKSFTFSAGATIIASEHNDNFDTIYNDYNGNITNANIASNASIANTKLDLTNIPQPITSIDINGGNIDGAIIGDNESAAITATTITAEDIVMDEGWANTFNVGSSFNFQASNQGDILYDNGDGFRRLTPGTSGHFLKTQGAGFDPQWAANEAGSHTAGSVTIATAATTRTTLSGTYVKLKELIPAFHGGTVNVSWDHYRISSSHTIYTKIYINDIAYGTEKSTNSGSPVTVSENNITISPGDVISIYGRTGDVSFQCAAENMIVQTIGTEFAEVL